MGADLLQFDKLMEEALLQGVVRKALGIFAERGIIGQHHFWGLEVDDKGFGVTLSFEGKHERLTVPWSAVVAFVDPSVQFGLQFTRGEAKTEVPAEAKKPDAKK